MGVGRYGPWSLKRRPFDPDGAISLAINVAVISNAVTEQISPQVWETPIYPDVSLMSLTAGYGLILKSQELEDGLRIGFHVRVEKGPWFGVDGNIYLQAYLQYPDGPTAFEFDIPTEWLIYVPKVMVKTPWWVDLAVSSSRFPRRQAFLCSQYHDSYEEGWRLSQT